MPIQNIPDTWLLASISERPEVTLRDWQAYEVQQPGRASMTRHLVRYCIEDRLGQVSSAIQRFDPTTMRGVTESGRVYQLLGKPGRHADADHTWQRWKRISSVTFEADVTSSLKGGSTKLLP